MVISPLKNFIGEIKIEAKQVVAMEKEIVLYLQGAIYRPYIYDACSTRAQLLDAIYNILPHPVNIEYDTSISLAPSGVIYLKIMLPSQILLPNLFTL